jgi:hypothetical protein
VLPFGAGTTIINVDRATVEAQFIPSLAIYDRVSIRQIVRRNGHVPPLVAFCGAVFLSIGKREVEEPVLILWI